MWKVDQVSLQYYFIWILVIEIYIWNLKKFVAIKNKQLQQKPFNMISLGQRETDYNNQLITLTVITTNDAN